MLNGEKGAFWNRVICSKYGEEGGWGTHEAGGPYGVGVHQIRLGFGRLQGAICCGNERKVCFWLDRWCREVSLREGFPSLFAISISKEAWLGRYGVVQWRGGSRTPQFFLGPSMIGS